MFDSQRVYRYTRKKLSTKYCLVLFGSYTIPPIYGLEDPLKQDGIINYTIVKKNIPQKTGWHIGIPIFKYSCVSCQPQPTMVTNE